MVCAADEPDRALTVGRSRHSLACGLQPSIDAFPLSASQLPDIRHRWSRGVGLEAFGAAGEDKSLTIPGGGAPIARCWQLNFLDPDAAWFLGIEAIDRGQRDSIVVFCGGETAEQVELVAGADQRGMANAFGQLGAVLPLVGLWIEKPDLVSLAVGVLSPDDPEFAFMCGDASGTEAVFESGVFQFLPHRR